MALPIVRCWDLTDAHVREAIGSRRAMGQLLKDMAAAARPGDGAPKILLAIARLADPACDWVEGFVRVEIDPVERQTQISITEDIGGGLRELLFPRLVLDAPIEELERSLRLAPQSVEPLVVQKDTTRLVLVQPGRARARPRPSFELAEDCLRDSLPPAVRDSVLAPLPPPSARAIVPAVPSYGGLPPNASTSFPVHEAPTRRQSRPAQHPRPRENGSPPIMEIPRAPKFLDFGDLAPKPRAEARKPEPEGPPPTAPRPAGKPEPRAADAPTPKKPSRLPPKKPSHAPPAKKPSRLPPPPRRG